MGKGLPRSLSGATIRPRNIEESDGETLQWKGNWSPQQYCKNDTVLDGEWLMVANKDTIDRAAPQVAGPPVDGIIGDPTWSIPSSVGVVYSGHTYTFTEPGRLASAKVWVPAVGAGLVHEVFLRDITQGEETAITTKIATIVPTSGGWVDIPLGGSLVNVNAVIQVFLSSKNRAGETVTAANWNTTDNLGPLAGEWRRSNSTFNRFYVSLTDADLVDRTALLEGLSIGDTMEFTDSVDPTKHILFELIGPGEDEFGDGYLTFYGTPISIGENGSPQRGRLAIGEVINENTATITYVEAVDYWLSNSVPFANAQGLVEIDGVVQSAMNENAYGIDLVFRGGDLSPDWDLASNIATVG